MANKLSRVDARLKLASSFLLLHTYQEMMIDDDGKDHPFY